MITSIIIPIHEINDVNKDLLKKSVESVKRQIDIANNINIFIVSSKEIINEIKGDYTECEFIINTGSLDFQSQINFAAKEIKSEYFSILEFDDEYSSIYFRNVLKYIQAYPDVDVFLPMMIEVDDKNNALKLTNDVVWSQQFVSENGEIGYLNQNVLNQYTDFKISGAIIKRSEFLSIGGFKSKIKLAINYEFFLRALNNGLKIFTIPKIGYRHFANRDGSMFDVYLKTMPINERSFWFETAKKESNFANDRDIDLTKISKIVVEE